MLVEISKLEAIRAIGVPAGWRARAAVESPVHLREHPQPTKLALLCSLLHLREREVTDALAQLLGLDDVVDHFTLPTWPTWASSGSRPTDCHTTTTSHHLRDVQ